MHKTLTLAIIKPLTSFSETTLFRKRNTSSMFNALSRLDSHSNELKSVFDHSDRRNYCSHYMKNNNGHQLSSPLLRKTSMSALCLNIATTKRFYSEEVFSYSKEEDVNDPLYVSEEEKRQKSEKMGMFYTCKPCKQRHYIEFSKHSYYKGVVITRCKNCKSLHLIADHLGWISDNKQSLEEMYGKIVKQSDLLKQQTTTEKNDK
ncbi:hypothetical protein FDP41_000378 [Naegleria fowleri]|uniref:DNL-type domain-containing protein n=1 Tax=Naegleria fowleri TaxID=5763 RepID=A0A6A5CGP6_NAEFO|nr:uncharacterized protein FDP41_000378 [Naegleria fowleri]KAF0984479.1 hypothetical protein FDP41_000378 [Naegleria fowleri]CAG4707674.1 unnamed protein product [Naegleria fowleri]